MHGGKDATAAGRTIEHLAIITAGGAGMFCGSCMHDNTWARALSNQGIEISLLPTYTPIRVDETDVSAHTVFLGGINLYLVHRFRAWRAFPRALTRWLDQGWLIKLATRFGVSNDASRLGELTLAMLAGEQGPQSREIDELADFVGRQLRPDAVCYSNALLVGTLRRLRERYDGPVYCTLQGDDIFLEQLVEPYRTSAIEAIGRRAADFDGFLVHSRYYRDFMASYLRLPPEKFQILPLGIDLSGHDGRHDDPRPETFTVGYFARICHEKGLHQLVDAFRIFHQRHPQSRLVAAGYLQDAAYLRRVRAAASDLGEAFHYAGSPATHAEKVALLRDLHVLSVPTVYHEPKGLYVLEALANGVPVVQPRHGAFPELLEATGGGLLCEPGDPHSLAAALERLYLDPAERLRLGAAGHAGVRRHYGPETMARRTIEVLSAHPGV